MDKEYKVGDEVWLVQYPLLIKCEVTRIDDQFVKKYETGGILFYDVDEPIGHSVGADELFDSFEDAKTNLISYEFAEVSFNVAGDAIHTTLTSRRESTIAFIKGTWVGPNTPPEVYAKMDAEFHIGIYPDKKRGTDWFNVFDFDF
jgi:hypothetical protein